MEYLKSYKVNCINEQDLILKIINNDRNAFKELVDQNQNLVYNTCYRLLGNKDDAEDIAQEVFLQVYKSINKFRGEAKLSSWIYRIAVNRSLNYTRIYKRYKWIMNIYNIFSENQENINQIPISSSEQPDSIFEKQERQKTIQTVIKSLPEKQRIAFILHKFEGLSYLNVAEIMKCSPASATSNIHRAKLNIQKKLIKVLKE